MYKCIKSLKSCFSSALRSFYVSGSRCSSVCKRWPIEMRSVLQRSSFGQKMMNKKLFLRTLICLISTSKPQVFHIFWDLKFKKWRIKNFFLWTNPESGVVQMSQIKKSSHQDFRSVYDDIKYSLLQKWSSTEQTLQGSRQNFWPDYRPTNASKFGFFLYSHYAFTLASFWRIC